jgi:hypothetical protein
MYKERHEDHIFPAAFRKQTSLLDHAMKTIQSRKALGLVAVTFLLLIAPPGRAESVLPAIAKANVNAPVTITNAGDAWTLSNGIIKLTLRKNNGSVPSIVYHGINIVGHPETWEQLPSGQVTSAVTIDPSRNGGERGEIAVKGINGRMYI